MNAIDVHNLVKKFGDFTAVNGVTFAVDEGEIFGLLGPNGAGKSTLIRMLTTLMPPTAGTATVNGHDIVREADGVRRSIGVIPQAMTSDLELSVNENLLIFAKLYGVPRDKRKKLIASLLEAVELTQWADKQVKNLSGGMRRRVEIARGLVHEPRIFFLDEPTTGLDPVSRVAVWDMLQKIKQQRDLTILVTTHYMDEADKLCDRIAIVDHGELKALDSPLKLKASIPGKNVIEVSFADPPPGWRSTLERLPGVESVTDDDHVFRLASANGPATTTALMEAAAGMRVAVLSLSVQSTTLDDVFVHYTGRALRDALQAATPQDSPFPNPFDPLRLFRLFVVIVVTAFALISLMFLVMVRVTDPLLPRAIFGVLNTLLYFSSGAVYPQQGFPAWMQVVAAVDPFTYAVHAFKSLLLKNTGFEAIYGDLGYLLVFSVVSMSAATLLFRRTL